MFEGEPLASMTLEHYPGMTEAELERIEAEAQRRFKLSASLIVHRVGDLKPGDNIVLVIACAPHRQDAFAAAEFLMDYLKTRAPFWKKEVLASGAARWVDTRESDEDAAASLAFTEQIDAPSAAFSMKKIALNERFTGAIR